jgi:DNA primase
LIPKDQIEKLNNSIDIVDVIGERIDLKRSGANYKARCPFHDERTASFMVSQSKQIYKCFGCGASGDSIKFVMSFDSLSYPDAIRHLASRYSIELVETNEYGSKDRSEDDKKELFRLLNKAACDLFFGCLQKEYSKSDSKVVKYLESRKIGRDLVEKFRLGFAPDDWNTLRSDHNFSSYGDEILVEAGLRKKNEKGNIYDQFRNRLMFPVMDSLGNIAAFSGRTLDDQIPPKYLNSPETMIYKKNQVLYGLFQAMETIRKTKELILVEGNVDLITMHKSGFTNTAAICGTAFTENHALLIKRNASKVIIMLDGDEPGKKSALKTAEILMGAGMTPSIVVLPEDSDPDSFLNSAGPDELRDLINKPQNVIDLNLILSGGTGKGAVESAFAARSVIETLKKVKDEIVLEYFIKDASEKLGIAEQTVRKAVGYTKKAETTPPRSELKESEMIVKNDDIVEFSLIYLMLSDADALKLILSHIKESDLKNKYASELFLKIYEYYEEGEPVKLNNILFDFDEKFKDFMTDFVIGQEKAFSGSDNDPESLNGKDKILKASLDGIRKISIRQVGERMKDLTSELKFTTDPARQNEIIGELASLKSRQITLSKNQNPETVK